MPVKDTPVVDLMERYADLEGEKSELIAANNHLSDEYGRLLSQLAWTHSMLSILIEQEGGVVQIDKKTLEEYDGPAAAIKVYEDVEGATYIIEVAFEEEDSK